MTEINEIGCFSFHLDKAGDKMRNKLRIVERLYMVGTLYRDVFVRTLRFIYEIPNIHFTWK